jgi:tetratricopeptide (TPR) repeat protein
MAIALNPRHPTTYLQYGSLGYCEHQLGRHREAVADFDEAIRSAPGNEPRLGSYHFYRSLSLRALGKLPRALADAREARRLGVAVPDSYLRSLGGD